jgi:hypothetical protein
MKVQWIVLIVSLSLVAGCASVDVDVDFDPAFDFSALRTYDWMPVPDRTRVNELTVKNIRYAAERELQAKGLTRSSEAPDFLIAVHGTKERKVDVEEYGYAYGSGFYGGPRSGDRRGRPYGDARQFRHAEYRRGVDVFEYQVGTLVMDFVDAKKKELIWRGSATGATDTRFTREDIQMAVTKILENFPPSK